MFTRRCEMGQKNEVPPREKKLVFPVDHIVAPSPENRPPCQHSDVDIPDGIMGWISVRELAVICSPFERSAEYFLERADGVV